MTYTHQGAVTQRLASSYAKVFTPALVLAALVLLAGIKSGLSPINTALLLTGIVVVPGLVYKRSKPWFRRRGIADHWRTILVAALTLLGAVLCYLLQLPEPVPATVAALFVGNAGLSFFRRWLNVSAHVSVLTFAVLWTVSVFGDAWLWILVLSPLMLLTRVSLNEHTWREALTGAVWGLATFGCFAAAMTWS